MKVKILILALFFASCTSHKLVRVYKSKQTDVKMEKLNIDALKKAKSKVTKKYKIEVRHGTGIARSINYIKTNLEDKSFMEISGSESGSNYLKRIYYPNKEFIDHFSFYPDTGWLSDKGKFIKSKIYYVDGIKIRRSRYGIAVWKHFNKKKELVSEINYDDIYAFTLNDVISLIKNDDLMVIDVSIDRIKNQKDRYIWIIKSHPNVYLIDGKTGEVFYKGKYKTHF